MTLDEEREAFEKWLQAQPHFRHGYADHHPAAPDMYACEGAQKCWQGWQARAHITQPAQAVDVAKAIGAALEECDVPIAYRYAIADKLTATLAHTKDTP